MNNETMTSTSSDNLHETMELTPDMILVHAKRELEIYHSLHPDQEYTPLMDFLLKKILETPSEFYFYTFKLVGHFIHKIGSLMPLTPLTGENHEWEEFDLGDPNLVASRNIRCINLIRYYKKTNPSDIFNVYMDAIIWYDITNKLVFRGTVENVDSSMPISFPCTPKSFIDKLGLKPRLSKTTFS